MPHRIAFILVVSLFSKAACALSCPVPTCFEVHGAVSECTALPPGADGSHYLQLRIANPTITPMACPGEPKRPLQTWQASMLLQAKADERFYISASAHTCSSLSVPLRANNYPLCCGPSDNQGPCALSGPLIVPVQSDGRR